MGIYISMFLVYKKKTYGETKKHQIALRQNHYFVSYFCQTIFLSFLFLILNGVNKSLIPTLVDKGWWVAQLKRYQK